MQHMGSLRLLLAVQAVTWVTVLLLPLITGAPETYDIPQASGDCIAKLVQLPGQPLNSSFPLNDTDGDVTPVQLRFALVNTGYQPVKTPFTISLINPGYLDAYDHVGYTLATEVEYGVVTLLSTSPDQELQPHSGSLAVITVTVEVQTTDPQPYNVLLDDRPCGIEIVDETGLTLQKEVQQSLTTRDGQIIGLEGEVIDLKGIAWFGFDDGNTMVDGLWEPDVDVDIDGLSMELEVVVQRMQLLGFNAIRFPFTFNQLLGSQQARNYTLPCDHPDLAQVVESVIPPYLTISVTNETAGDLAQAQLQQAYTKTEGTCNTWMTGLSVLERYVFIANFFAHNGFYIVAVQQSNYEPITLDNQNTLASSWATLVTKLSQDPVTRLRLMIDPFNELDKFNIQWENNQTNGLLGQTALYLSVFDALYEVNPYMLFFVQGTGQKNGGLVANYGDGLATDKTVLNSAIIKIYPLSDPNPFFRALMKRSYLNQVVMAPHVYPPSISQVEGGPTTLGVNLFKRLSDVRSIYDTLTDLPMHSQVLIHPGDCIGSSSFGYLNKQGYCMGGICHKFPVVMGETGSGFDSLVDIDFMDDLATYMHNIGPAFDRRHNRIGSYFLWAWNANSAGNLGLLEADWQTVKWRYIEWLQYLGLEPWYVQSTPQRISQSASGSVADVVTEPLPVITVPSPPPPVGCPDTAPDATYTCMQQLKFGKCDADFIVQGQYCAATCGRCASYVYPPPGPPCPDVRPDPVYTCEQQASFGKCNESWMLAGGYCAAACNRCDHPNSLVLGGPPGALAPGPGPSQGSGLGDFPSAMGMYGYPYADETAPTGESAPDLHSGVNVDSDVSQATLQQGSGGGVAASAADQQGASANAAQVTTAG